MLDGEVRGRMTARSEINAEKLAKVKQRDTERVPLRVDAQTVILVPKENATREFAERMRVRMVNSYNRR